jgi:hypothetical protein
MIIIADALTSLFQSIDTLPTGTKNALVIIPLLMFLAIYVACFGKFGSKD